MSPSYGRPSQKALNIKEEFDKFDTLNLKMSEPPKMQLKE